MATVETPAYTVDLPLKETQAIFRDSILKADNPLASMLPIYTHRFGRDEKEFLFMRQPSGVLRAGTSCDDWNPSVNVKNRRVKIEMCRVEMNATWCFADIFSTCRELVANDGWKRYFEPTSELRATEGALLTMVLAGLSESVYQLMWFGNKQDITSINVPPFYTNRSIAPEIDVFDDIAAMLTSCDGWMKRLVDATDPSIPAAERVKYVDTNSWNGLTGLDATNPNDVRQVLDKLINVASPKLKAFNIPVRNGRARSVILAQPDIFDALKRALQSLNVFSAYENITNGVTGQEQAGYATIPYDNFLVIRMDEWGNFDSQMGAVDPTTNKSLNQRLVFVAPGQLISQSDIVTDELGVDNSQGMGLLIRARGDLYHKGKRDAIFALRVGMNFLDPSMVVVGWNSETQFKPEL